MQKMWKKSRKSRGRRLTRGAKSPSDHSSRPMPRDTLQPNGAAYATSKWPPIMRNSIPSRSAFFTYQMGTDLKTGSWLPARYPKGVAIALRTHSSGGLNGFPALICTLSAHRKFEGMCVCGACWLYIAAISIYLSMYNIYPFTKPKVAVQKLAPGRHGKAGFIITKGGGEAL